MGANRNPKIVGGNAIRETTWANSGNGADYPNQQIAFSDVGITAYSNGTDWLFPSGGIANTTYTNGLLTAWTENGIAHAASYLNGKVYQIVAGTMTKTFTWAGDNLVSVVVS